MKTQIFIHDDDVSVVTDCIEERDFLETFTDALNDLGGPGAVDYRVIASGFEILAKLRGYKSSVQERRMLAAGRWAHPSEKPDGEGERTMPELSGDDEDEAAA